jgi:hypothetical protein
VRYRSMSPETLAAYNRQIELARIHHTDPEMSAPPPEFNRVPVHSDPSTSRYDLRPGQRYYVRDAGATIVLSEVRPDRIWWREVTESNELGPPCLPVSRRRFELDLDRSGIIPAEMQA